MLSVCVSVPHYSEPHRAIALARPLGAECERALSGWGEKQPPRQRLHRALDPQLRAFVEQTAAREDRTIAGQIRHIVAEAARVATREQQQERAA